MEPSPPPESQSQGAARFPSDISVLSSSSTTTTATGSASQTSKSRGKSRGGSRGGNKKRKGSEDAKDDPSDPDPVDDEGTRSAHILRAKNEPASYLAPTYRGIDPNRAWPNQSRNELPLFGLAVKLPLEEDAPEYKEGWHFICMASETRRKKAREGVGAVEMVEYLNPKTGKVKVKSWATLSSGRCLGRWEPSSWPARSWPSEYAHCACPRHPRGRGRRGCPWRLLTPSAFNCHPGFHHGKTTAFGGLRRAARGRGRGRG